jgi:CRP/FNR family cyclic AMP-dependent transcriptional regulator
MGRFLTAEEREAARELSLPVRTLPKGPRDVGALLQDAGAFGGLILEGMLLERLQVADHLALRLLGPGDIVSLVGAPRSMLLADADARAAVDTRLALFGKEMLAAAHRWPRIVAGLHVRTAEQSERVAAQLAICQLPRVDQRLLALMWWLAESWGQVTSVGTVLPMTMTHDALGALIGARRPTVTLALGELSDRGAIVRQDRGWLLLEAPPPSTATMPKLEEPHLLEEADSGWSIGVEYGRELSPNSYAELMQTVSRLREEHVRNRERVRKRLAEMAVQRERTQATRQRITEQARARHRPAPSS